VKESLIVDLQVAAEISGCCKRYDVPETLYVLKYDFVLVFDVEVTTLRKQRALDAAFSLGLNLKLDNRLLVR
jgi:hypothetical protein